MITTGDALPDPFSDVDGLSLAGYVEVCRDLVRNAGDSARRTEEVLAAYGLNRDRWAYITDEWSDRVRRHLVLRAEFRRIYAGEAELDGAGIE